MRRRGGRVELRTVNRAVAELEFPSGIWKTCPWQPRQLIETGLRQWLRCAGAALRDGQVIGMPSRAVDETWHGFILCTAAYARFCEGAYGQFLHHYPDSADDADALPPLQTAARLGRTVIAWTLVAEPGEVCVLWDLDSHVGVEQPWGIPPERVEAVRAELAGHSPATP